MGSGNGDEWSSDGSSGSDSDSYSDSDSDSSGSDSDSEEAFEPAAQHKKKAAPKKRKAKAPKKRKQAPKPQDAGPESWAVSKAWRQMSFAERSPPIAESDGSAAQAAPIEEDEEDEDDEPQVRERAAAGPARLPLPSRGARRGPRAQNGGPAPRALGLDDADLPRRHELPGVPVRADGWESEVECVDSVCSAAWELVGGTTLHGFTRDTSD